MNAGQYSILIHRNRDLALDSLWRKEHDAGKCGGAKGHCYICCKRKLFNFVRGVFKRMEKK